MSDIPLPHAAETPEPAEAPAGVHTPTLKQARERAGLHVVALAAMLKVPVNKLEALEAGRYADLPDMTFARALAKSVCRQLKIDPAPILAGLPQSTPIDLGHLPKGLNTSMPSASPGGARAVVVQQLPWPAAAAVLLVVVAAVLWWAVPAKTPATGGLVSGVPAAHPMEPTRTPATALVGPPPAVAPVEAAPAPAPTVPAPAPLPAAPLANPLPVAAAPAPAVPLAANTPPVLQLRATQTAWVEVVGRSGKLLIQRTLQPGESVVFAEDAPYAVVTGRADATEVLVRGQALDLGALARNNVARFSAP